MNIINQIASDINAPIKDVEAVLELLGEGATVPFIARYRKDKTGGLDEVQILQIQDLYKSLSEFADRKAFIIKTITEQEKMTDALMTKINAAITMNQLEDIYLPYKPKRRTKAQIARENGLQPLADLLMQQGSEDIDTIAASYISENVKDSAAALQGAREIIAEEINENAVIRAELRKLFEKKGQLIARIVEGKEEEGKKYKDYFEYNEAIMSAPSHRILAIMRGFMEGVLRMHIEPEMEDAIAQLEAAVITRNGAARMHLEKAVKDAYRRLLQPSLETEFRQMLKTKADEEAIQVFADNLKQLLLSAPLGEKRLLAIDPGYRTGCKVVVIDEKGDLLINDLIYIHEQNFRLEEAKKKILSLVEQYKIEGFAIGDGTAGRETEMFIKSLGLNIPVILVNEDGASIYSASAIARDEFPDHDITVRGAVSIGRRLMDPLAELVKIDPKSIGVGQYQHDVNQIRLKDKLDQTVESCVNAVGVNLNTAGKHLLSYISGIGPSIAENIVAYRKENGAFKSRKQLLKVPRLGAKAYEQCAGFLKVINGTDRLDNSSVHPEAYPIVEKISKEVNLSIDALLGNTEVLAQIDAKKYVDDTIGLLTINDILKELKKPGLDPREAFQSFEFANIFKIEDVYPGMIVPGVVTNITKFGAFVDIGVKQDGLVHVSEVANRFISDPSEALQLNQQVQVKVLEVDMNRSRISLSIKQALPAAKDAPAKPRDNGDRKKKDGNGAAGNKGGNTNWFSSLESLKSKLK